MKKPYNRPVTLSLQMRSEHFLLAASESGSGTNPNPAAYPGMVSNDLPGLPSTAPFLRGTGEEYKVEGGSIRDAW